MIDAMTPSALYAVLGLPAAPIVIALDAAGALERLIPGSICRPAADVARWARALPSDRSALVYASDVSAAQRCARELGELGVAACFLEGGLDAWLHTGLPSVRARSDLRVPGASRWITRERPKIDRLACPWLVRRFIDPSALFFYTAAQRVRAEAVVLDAQPYDIADVTFSHRGPECSFDAFLREFELRDPVLDELATIVRAADTGALALSPQAPGLLAISLGLSAGIADDILLLEAALPVYDALYAWCKTARRETHAWPQTPAS